MNEETSQREENSWYP